MLLHNQQNPSHQWTLAHKIHVITEFEFSIVAIDFQRQVKSAKVRCQAYKLIQTTVYKSD